MFNMFNAKQNTQQINDDKFETSSSTSTTETIAPPFINEQVNQWPTWTNAPTNQAVQKNPFSHKNTGVAKKSVKINQMGFVEQPKYEGIVYEKVESVPYGSYIGRGSTRYYKYYVDAANDVVYYYPFQGMMKTQPQKLEYKFGDNQLLKEYQFLHESIKVVPMSVYQTTLKQQQCGFLPRNQVIGYT